MSRFKKVELIQGSPEWLQWRRDGIGASDIAVLTGDNPYKTPRQLWEDKCGYAEEEPLNQAMKWGIANEPIARRWLIDAYMMGLDPICMEEGIYRASLDGWNEEYATVFEIKCPVSRDIIDNARMGAIPTYWFVQVEWQLMVSCAKRGYAAIWDPEAKRCYVIEVHLTDRRRDALRAVADEFWKHVVNGVPPGATNADYIELEDDKLKELLIEYRYVAEHEKLIKDRKNKLREQILAYAPDNSFQAYGYKVRCGAPSVSYDHKQMEMDGIELDKYRKIGQPVWRISCPK